MAGTRGEGVAPYRGRAKHGAMTNPKPPNTTGADEPPPAGQVAGTP